MAGPWGQGLFELVSNHCPGGWGRSRRESGRQHESLPCLFPAPCLDARSAQLTASLEAEAGRTSGLLLTFEASEHREVGQIMSHS